MKRKPFTRARLIKENVMLKTLLSVLTVVFISIFFSNSIKATEHNGVGKKKVLFVESYHRGYSHSDDLTMGILNVFNATINPDDVVNNENSRVNLRIVRMDTKKNKSTEFKKAAALKVKGIIDQWEPDLVIASDDNAVRYLLVPYYKNSEIPFVFCGVNWSADEYDLPRSHITGMLEAALVPQMVETLRPYVKGDSIGILIENTLSGKKNVANIKNRFTGDYTVKYVDTLDEWKAGFKEFQSQVDMLLLGPFVGIKGWDHDKANAFAYTNTKIPSFSWSADSNQKSYLIAFRKKSIEQGEWAAKAALQILDGKSPADIPVAINKKSDIHLNMRLAKKLGLKFPIELILNAHLLSAE